MPITRSSKLVTSKATYHGYERNTYYVCLNIINIIETPKLPSISVKLKLLHFDSSSLSDPFDRIQFHVSAHVCRQHGSKDAIVGERVEKSILGAMKD